MTERALKLLRIQATDAKEPMDPMLMKELTEQMLSMEFVDLMDRNEFLLLTSTRV